MIILWILIGTAAGVVSGMGIGGGTILIPALAILMKLPQQSAQNVNLLYFIPTAVVALVIHWKNGKIQKNVLMKIILVGIGSAVLGSCLAVRMDAGLLKRIFGFFLFAMGIYEFRRKTPKRDEQGKASGECADGTNDKNQNGTGSGQHGTDRV